MRRAPVAQVVDPHRLVAQVGEDPLQRVADACGAQVVEAELLRDVRVPVVEDDRPAATVREAIRRPVEGLRVEPGAVHADVQVGAGRDGGCEPLRRLECAREVRRDLRRRLPERLRQAEARSVRRTR